MAAEEEQAAQEKERRKAPARQTGRGEIPLESEHGRTTIDDAVVAKVADIAAREVPGVYDLGAAPARAVGAVAHRVGVAAPGTAGVTVEVGERQAAVDLTLVVEYGESVPRVAQEVRDNVVRRIEGICGLEVTEVNVGVNDLHLAGEEEPTETRVE